MSPDRRRQVESLFQQTVDLPSAERAAFLDANCPDTELRRQVERLLAAMEADESDFMSEPAIGQIAESDPSAATSDDAPSDVTAARPTIRYFDDYQLQEEIGHGGMGAVYKARQVSLDRVVAVKLLLASRFASEKEVQRFPSEAEAVANLDHANIVPIYEVDEHEGRQYFSMKLVEGGSLASRMSGYVKDHRKAARLLRDVAHAMHHAHLHGNLHRDLKPAYILIDDKGTPYVTDFGLVKRLDKDHNLTQTEAMMGTPSYMAPEQAAGQARHVTTAADIYALGAIIYEMLTGRPPFKADTPLETLLQVQVQEPSSIRSLNAKADRDLETICFKCLAKEASKRYVSAAELAQDLDRWLTGRPIRARPVSPVERFCRLCRRYPLPTTLVMLVIVSLIGGAVIATYFALDALEKKREVKRQLET